MSSRLLLAGLAAFALVVGAAAVAIVLIPRPAAPSPGAAPDHGSATTMTGAAGFEVTVTAVSIPAAGGRVSMLVSFRNTSSNQQRADPGDFAFRDASGQTARPVFDAACPRWTRADLHPAGGAGQSPRDREAQQVGTTFGPVPLCFSVAHQPAGSRTLVWSPDVGLLAAPVAIALS